MDQKNQVKYLDPSIDFKEYVIHSIQSTNELYENSDLQDDVRNMLMNKCLTLSKKEMFTAKSLTKWASLTRRIIDDFGLKYLVDILAVIPQQSLEIANYALSLIINIGSPEDAPPSLIKLGIKSLEKKSNEIERGKYVENRSLDKILIAFKKQNKEFIPYKFAFDGIPIVELNQNDRNKLGQFGKILESKVQITGSLQEAAQTAGKKFRDNPNIENAAQLVGIIRFVIQDTLNLKPFMVQCLSVGALLLHRINHSEGLKGRIAQIATDEGKSIIVAMLSASIALTGSFVDVISSSFYLAERDAEKFEPFYEKLGLKCGTLNEHDSSPYVDFHIIYSTNTGFEFAFLREGISGKSTLLATPLYKNTLVKRIPMTAIVDEAGNLFIDTVTNSARIAVGSSSQRTWIFKPFFKAVIENKVTNKLQARHFLLSIAQTQSEKDSLEDISDHQLDRWIENAIYANNSLKKDVDYVVGFNKDIQQYEIQIVDQQNTGRINIGCRWSGGLHEFVEVKENLQVQPQSLTIASVSHPSFFGRYQEIYGLTGTMGEEVERNEIRSIYKVDTFDVPPNRVSLRKRDDTLNCFN